MEPIKNIVSGIIGRMSSGNGGAFGDIQALWVKISKEKESRITDFKDGCVTISAKDALRLVRLNLNRESLLKELQKEFPLIKKLYFRVDKI